MADPKVNFVQKKTGGAADAGAAAGSSPRKFKVSLPAIVAVFSTIFFFGFGALSLKVIWAHQMKQLDFIKTQKEAKKREFEKKELEYSMKPMEVNVPAEEEGLLQLQVELSFQLDSEYAKKEFQKKESQIRDDILLLLSAKKEVELREVESRKKIQEEIVSRVNKFLSSKAQVKDVYFPNFFIE